MLHRRSSKEILADQYALTKTWRLFDQQCFIPRSVHLGQSPLYPACHAVNQTATRCSSPVRRNLNDVVFALPLFERTRWSVNIGHTARTTSRGHERADFSFARRCAFSSANPAVLLDLLAICLAMRGQRGRRLYFVSLLISLKNSLLKSGSCVS